jgi:predicted HAD superfamily Cof-like phosphohydrolase
MTSQKENSAFKDILDFQQKFNVPFAISPSLLEGEMFEFRTKFLQEELNEFIEAHQTNDLELALDSLVDLAVVLYGTAQIMGITHECWVEAWNEVHRANMSKERAVSASQSKRGTAYDIIKPEGWQAPDHKPILQKYTRLATLKQDMED